MRRIDLATSGLSQTLTVHQIMDDWSVSIMTKRSNTIILVFI
ncbi:hypothetical protein BH20ACI2_BH20ACI2_05010 [soil metagenome]